MKKTCQVEGCKADALPEPAAQGRAGPDLAVVDLYLCEHHRAILAHGTAAHVSLEPVVKATPAEPAQ